MRFLLASILLLFFSACFNEPDCVITSTSLVKITMKTLKKSVDTVLTFNYVTISGTNTILYQNTATSKLSLPLNPKADQTTFILRYGTKVDSIRVRYTPLNVILSPTCGAYVYYKDLATDTTSFSNHQVVNSQLSTSATVNIEIKL